MKTLLNWGPMVLVCMASSLHAGVIEICKDSNPPGALTGLYSFSITGQTGVVVVPAGACTDSFLLPDGLATITELSDPHSTLTMVSTFPENRLISFNPQTLTATVLIVPGVLTDPSSETLVDFVNIPNAAGAIPEPQTMLLAGCGMAMFAVFRRKGRSPLRSLSSNLRC